MNCRLSLLIALILGVTLSSTSYADRQPGADIKLGKWAGFIQADGRSEGIALTMDSFLVKPPDVNQYPKMNFLFKMSLGGYGTSEFQAQLFDDPHYDFDQGLLTLDSAANDWTITAFVYADPTEMKGRAFIKSSGVWATVYLYYQTDEPDPGDPTETIPTLAPKLAGQYEGNCGSETAVLQVETGRGLIDDRLAQGFGLASYGITGAIGVANQRCSNVNGSGGTAWCLDHGFSAGTYDPFTGRLQLRGSLENDDCARDGNEVVCRTRIVPSDSTAVRPVAATCTLKAQEQTPQPFLNHYRLFELNPSPSQAAPLPSPNPPFSSDLVRAASGVFSGFLHHEGSDRYQPMRLSVTATTSTENPHNPAAVFVSATSMLYFGRNFSSEFVSHQFDRIELNVVKGYTLKSNESDTFLQITRWTEGFIEGVLFSRQFGRVGSFQVLKGTTPVLPSTEAAVESLTATTIGPQERMDGPDADHWETSLIIPRQPRDTDRGYVVIQGNYRLFAGGVGWGTQSIVRGTYDFFSNSVAWFTEGSNTESKIVSGFTTPEGLKLVWPHDRTWSVPVYNVVTETYLKN